MLLPLYSEDRNGHMAKEQKRHEQSIQSGRKDTGYRDNEAGVLPALAFNIFNKLFLQFDSITAEQILFTFYGNSSPYAHTAMSSGSKQWANQRKHSCLFGVWFDGHAMGMEWAKLLMGFYMREIVLFCFPTSTWPSLILYVRSFHAAFLCHPVIMFSQEVFLVAFHLWFCISVII